MNKCLNKIDQLNINHLFGFIVAASILLAAWMQTIQHGWINPDSVLYLEQARLFSLGDWESIVKVFNWPLYGVCIGIVHKLSSLSIHVSAQLLNMLFFGMATASFLTLIKLAGGNNRTLVSGTLLLFSSQYIVGDVLEMLMRDEGFWAFYLSALVFFTLYYQHQKLRDALLWQVCIIVATLFRIEAILYLLLLPLFIMFGQPSPFVSRFKKMLHTYSIGISAAIIISILLATQSKLSMEQFGRLQEVFTVNLYQEFTQKLFTQADIMSTQVLGKYLDEFAIPGLLLTFLYVLGAKIITATGLVGTGLATLNLKYSQPSLQPITRRILLAAGLISLISMILIITKVFVLSSRYVVALAWVLLIFASFYLAHLSLNADKKYRITFLILCLILCLGFIKNILPKQQGYNYMQDAVAWIKMNKRQNDFVFYSDPRMRYFAKAKFSDTWGNDWLRINSEIKMGSIEKNNYLLIKHSRKNIKIEKQTLSKLENFREVVRFYDRKKKKYVAIYKKSSKE